MMKKFGKTQAGEMPFLDHLEELRWRLIYSLAAILVCAIIGFLLVKQYDVLGILVEPVEPFLQGSKLKYLSPTDPFFITLKLGIIVGPGTFYGDAGNGFVRVALTGSDEGVAAAAARLSM